MSKQRTGKSASTSESTSAARLSKLVSQGRFLGVFLGGMVGWLILPNAARWILTTGFSTRSGSVVLATVMGAVIGFILGGWGAKAIPTSNERRMVRPFGLAVSFVFLVLWLLPILWVGGSKKSTPGMPYYMQNLHRISCLFTHSSKDWKTVHYQVRFKGSDEWVEGFEPGFFPQSIFGYRSRFNRMIGQSLRGGSRGGGRRWEIAKHIQTRWAVLYPNDPAITHVRYIRVSHPVYGSHCMANEPWKKLPLSTYPINKWRYEDTIDLTKPYKYKPKKKKKKKSKRAKKATARKKLAPLTKTKQAKPTNPASLLKTTVPPAGGKSATGKLVAPNERSEKARMVSPLRGLAAPKRDAAGGSK